MRLTPKFFQLSEFKCRCCGRVQIAAALVCYLDWLRRAWDGPIVVNSGFRCSGWNAKVGGAPRSRHMIGCAADIRPREPELIDVFKTLVRHTTADLGGWEVREYPTFVHVGVPRMEETRLWMGGSIALF